jgi:integrase
MACAALRLVALTGLRRGEAYGLRWSEVDLDGSSLRLADSKTGRSMRAVGETAVRTCAQFLGSTTNWFSQAGRAPVQPI